MAEDTAATPEVEAEPSPSVDAGSSADVAAESAETSGDAAGAADSSAEAKPAEDEPGQQDGDTSGKPDDASATGGEAQEDQPTVEEPAAEEEPAEEPAEEEEPAEPTVEELNAKSSNTHLEDGGIRMDDPSTYQFKVFNSGVGAASGAWLETHNVAPAAGYRSSKIFSLSESSGSEEQRKRAHKYARLALAANAQGWASIDPSAEDEGDLSILAIPEDIRVKCLGNSVHTLSKWSEDHSVLALAIDDGNSVAPVVEVKAPELWLEVGKKVQYLKKGDIRSKTWASGTVSKLYNHNTVGVTPENGGADISVEWRDGMRPDFGEGEEVEVFVEKEVEGMLSTSSWTGAKFVSWSESGKVNVKQDDDTEACLSPRKHVRRPLPAEEPTEKEAVPEKPIRLAIFGSEENRVKAVLFLLSSIEWSLPGYHLSRTLPLPPAIDEAPAGSSDDEKWYTGTIDLGLKSDGTSSSLAQVGKACENKVIIELTDKVARVVGPAAPVRLALVLIQLASEADRREVTTLHAPTGIDEYITKIPMPHDLINFIVGKRQNRITELEAAEDMMVFFVKQPFVERHRVDTEDLKTKEDSSEGEEPAEKPAEGDADGKAEDKEGAAADGAGADGAEDKAEAEKTEEKKEEEKQEEEWPEEEEKAVTDILLISLNARARLRARLPLIRAVESKSPQFVVPWDPEEVCGPEDETTTDVTNFPDDVMGWLGGKQGRNRQAMSAASGGYIELLGHSAYCAGTGAERARARDYMKWLLEQKRDSGSGLGQREVKLSSADIEKRDDVLVVMLTPDEKASIVKELADLEAETKTFMFFQYKPDLEYLKTGEQLTITRGGRTFYIEIAEAPTEDEGAFSCKLLPADTWLDEDEASKVPLLIFSFDESTRQAAEKRVRDTLYPQEDNWGDDNWGEDNNDSWNQNDSWNEAKADDKWGKNDGGGDKWGKNDGGADKWGKNDGGGDKWAKSGNDDNSWDKGGKNTWDKSDQGRSSQGDKWNGKQDQGKQDNWGGAKDDNTWNGKQDHGKQDNWGGAKEDKWSRGSSWGDKSNDKKGQGSGGGGDAWANYKKSNTKDDDSWNQAGDSWGGKDDWKGTKSGGDAPWKGWG